jgi:predicted HicB family RNase H-like nuclease
MVNSQDNIKTRMQVLVSEEVHTRLRVYCARPRCKLSQFTEDAIAERLNRLETKDSSN